jgi:type I restriction enzyme, S subunit
LKFTEKWELKEFKDVVSEFSSGATPYRGKSEYYKGEIRWITSGELNYNYIKDTIEKISKDAKKKTNLKLHPKGTFVMAITGLEAETTRGRCAIIEAPSTTNQSCMALYPKDNLSLEFLFHYYRLKGNELAFKYCQGTKQQSYTARIVKRLPIKIPPTKEEQSEIGKILSKTDDLIEQLDYLITKKKNVKQGAMEELLTGKKRLEGFNETWKEITLDKIGVFTKGKGIKKTEIVDSGLSCIRYGEIYTKYNIIAEEIHSHIPLDIAKKSQQIRNGNLLFSGSGETPDEIGKCIVYLGEDPCYAGGDTIIFSVNGNDPLFLAFLLNFDYVQKQKSSMAQGDMVVHIYSSALKKLKIKIPEISEQSEIAKILSEINSEIKELETKRDKYIMIKNGMMQKLLTGEIRLV